MDEPCPASLSLAGLHAADTLRAHGGVRGLIAWAASLGFRSVHPDAAAPEIRPRSLDRSGRRDLAATIRREGMGFTGLDLWIPREHFEPGEHADRAHAALLGAVELAADLAGLVGGPGAAGGSAAGLPVVSVTLPDGYAGLPEITARCDALGVLVEDFGAEAQRERVADEKASEAGKVAAPGAVRPGVDTGRLLLRDLPPGKAFARHSKAAATLRLNDADDTGRRPMGAGRLDIATITALHATLTPGLPIVTDLRGLDDPARGARAAVEKIPAGGLPGLG